jgi:histidinol-phosphatase
MPSTPFMSSTHRTDPTEDLRLAHVLADAADSLTLSRFRALDLTVATKPDLSPVTDADTAVEEQIRSTLSRARSRDAVVGEEFGSSGTSARRWIIDPIDGTKNFVRGIPVWATLIGLMDGDEVVAGLVSAPALGRRWWAGRGVGAWTGRSLTAASRCQVSGVSRLSDASLSHSSVTSWDTHGRLGGFLDLNRACWRSRAYGDFWSHVLVAEGSVDIAAEPALSLWDLAALVVIVEEAGGRCSRLDGGSPTAAPDLTCTSLVTTNGRLHDEVLHRLAEPKSGRTAPG